ncbi:MAG: N-acetylglucosamine-regulated TonB-dependent outer membrane receptor [Rhodanobacteraceae bacterium]|jgi:iron complex outermembrane receptor protein|nr:MAG: N-acetylglucosamine-regulated TonB-dependent outer membrane receptor [Rhodanobacteraceae bacterium]
MKFRKSMLSASIATALLFAAAAQAQNASPQGQSNDQQQPQAGAGTQTDSTQKKKDTVQQLETIQVVGVRAAQALSIETKKAANSQVEVVSAVDIGKLPAKNVADTIAQLPGVNIADAAGAEGGFDEADRASIRGSAPSLTLTTVNGHSIGSGDWFVLGGGGTRSVSFAMLPSEVVNQVVVHMTPEAKLLEGGAAGTIDIITRKPLDFSQQLSLEGSVGGVYADLPGKTTPQASGLLNWKNASSTFGVMVQAFYEKRDLQREGQELLGYSYIPTGSPAALSLGLSAATPGSASTGVFYPNLPGAALFTQTRKREGGSVDLQWKATDNLTFNLDAFYSHLDATDYNRNYMLRTRDQLPKQAVTGTIVGNILTSANLPGAAPGEPLISQGIYDMISRPGESESSQFVTLDADWQATNNLGFKFQIGTTKGTGNTPTQDVMEMDTGFGSTASYAMNGLGTPLNWSMSGTNNAFDPATAGLDWIFGEQNIHVVDKERWFQADGTYDFDNAGPLSSLEFGVRYAKHDHDSPTDIAQGPNFASAVQFGQNSTIYPPAGGNYPGSFASDLGVGQMPSDIWFWTPAQLAQLNALYANRKVTDDPGTSRFYPNGIYSMTEKNGAAYIQANFTGEHWTANAGLRYVSTDENIGYTSPGIQEASYAVGSPPSAFYPGGWYWNYYKHNYNKVLPSFNVKFDLNSDGSLLTRWSASQTLTRQDYTQLAGFLSLNDPTVATELGGGSGSNPRLKPILSTNFSASLEWYFAPRGLLAGSVYAMDLNNYYDYGTVTRTYLNNLLTYNKTTNPSGAPIYSNYLVSIPVNVNGTLKGVTLNYIQPIGDHFGVSFNYTYATGHSSGGTYMYNADGTLANNVAAGDRPLFGTSKNTANASVFYEDAHWNARVNYTYRSKFYDGVMSSTGQMALLPYWQSGQGYLSFSAGYKLNDHLSFSFDAMNLNNPHLKYFINGSQAGLGFSTAPEAFYVNGRQYYFNVNFKFGSGAPAPLPPATPPPPPAPEAAPPPPPPQNVVIDLRGVNFKFDRPKKGETNIDPTLKPPASESLAILSQAVDTLNRYPQVQVEIDGYTDSTGSAQYNQALSERRANIVDAYLTSHGIAASRITAVKGFGEADPIDTNKTAAGRQRNRRVEFKVGGEGIQQGQPQQ